MKEDAYYYSILPSQEEKMAYQAIYKSLTSHARQCELQHVNPHRVSSVFQSVINDHPEIYYIHPQVSLGIQSRGFSQLIILSFQENYKREQQLIDREISRAITQIKSACQGKDVLEQYMLILDYLVDNVDYEINNALNQNAASALYYHKAQCSGISSAYKLLCDEVGLYCITVNSNAKVNGVMSPHAWNIVKVNNHYYHIDSTYVVGHNKGKSKPYSYHYAFCSDKAFINDHVLLATWPKCDDDSLEKLSNLTPGKTELLTTINSFYELRNALTEKIKKHEKNIPMYLNIEISDKQFEINLVSSVKMVASSLGINIKSVSYQKTGKELQITLDY